VTRKVTDGSSFKKAVGVEVPTVNGKEFPLKLGFTKSNELFVGRLAMLGFASSLIGEVSPCI
jgi:photosystem II protein